MDVRQSLRCNSWLLATALIGGACTGNEEPDGVGRSALLDFAIDAIAVDALSAQPSPTFASARSRVAAGVSKDELSYARNFQLAGGRGSAVAADPQLRAARGETAVALGTKIDPARERDAASAQQGLDALLRQAQLAAPGATSCDALGAKADACAVALLIIEVKRSEASQTVVALDASTPMQADAAQPITPGSQGEAGVTPAQPVAALPPTAAPEGACRAVYTAPASLCEASDPHEPNDDAYSDLSVASGCARLEARLDKSEKDMFRFTPAKSDPVRIELGYTAVGNADLSFTPIEFSGSTLAQAATTRNAPNELETGVYAMVAQRSYGVRVAGTGVSCQPYSMIVDTNYCTDALEDNDSANAATKLTFDAQSVALIEATSHRFDEDFYEYVTTKADPVRISGSYAVPLDLSADLTLTTYNAMNSSIWTDSQARATPEEQLGGWVTSKGVGSVFRFKVAAAGSGCVSYKLKVDGAACTDGFEDNDTDVTAKALALGSDHTATVITDDDDFYDISALAGLGGSCTITYTLPEQSKQTLTATIYNRTGSSVTTANSTGAGLEKTIKASWNAADVVRLKVAASTFSCQSYTVRCAAS